jgi:8-oxo-dGTP diphosphatase
MKIRRVGAYGVCRDDAGRILLVRNSGASEFPGLWSLPGGGIEQGEHPDDAVVREFTEETGLPVRIEALRTVTADVVRLPRLGDLEHTDRIVYDVAPAAAGRELRAEASGTTDLAAWIGSAELDTLPLMPFTAEVLGRPHPPVPAEVSDEPLARPQRVQRFGAYAAATDPAGRVLLTRIAAGYPGTGLWHLAGGGTDHGETPEQGLARELMEETGQRGRVTGLLGLSHRYDPTALGPEGRRMDWHVVRVLFRVEVDEPTDPVVLDQGGSTDRAAWFTFAEVGALGLTELARGAVAGIKMETAG